MNFISSLISENLINAVGWTILHSIWQGAAVALGFMLLMFFLRRYSSRTRYFIGVMALMLVLGISLATFINIYNPGAGANMAITPAGSDVPVLAGTAQTENLYRHGIFSTFKGYFDRHLPLIVTLWFLGILVLVLKLAGGFLYNQRLKYHNTRPLNKSWQSHLQKLSRQVGIKKPVRLLESALVKVPITLGFLKPFILLPVGMVTGLPRDQVEALLAHELAHILRRDYLFNIMQNVIDILYFYHPGVRWMSANVRAERENCCDDIAVSLCGDSINFARALTSIDGSGLAKASPALAAADKSTMLFSRIKRLFSHRKKSSEFAERFVGACVLALFILTLVVSANASAGLKQNIGESAKSEEIRLVQAMYEKKKAEKKEKSSIEQGELDGSTGANLNQAAYDADEKEEKKEPTKKIEDSKKKKEKEERLRKIEWEKFERLRTEMRKNERELRTEMRKNERELRAEMSKKERELRTEMRKNERELRAFEREKFAKMEAEFKKQVEKLRVIEREKLARLEQELKKRTAGLEKLDKEKLAKLEKELKKRAEELQEENKEKIEDIKEALEKEAAELKEHEYELQERAEKLHEENEERIEEIKEALEKEAAELKEHEKELQERAEELKKEAVFFKTLKKELLKDKLIEDEEDFEFKLTPKGLWTDGKKQSKKVFKKYKKIYETHTGKKLEDMKIFRIVNRK